MQWPRIFEIAYAALGRNRLRTLLTILGVVIGISSVTIIVSAGQSLNSLVIDQVSSFGSDVVQTEVRVPSTGGGVASQVQGVVVTSMTESDRQAIVNLPYIKKAYSAVITQEIVSWQGNIDKVLIYGVSTEYIDIDATEIAEGKFFSQEEDDSLARVVVLGDKVKKSLFGSSQAIGQNVKINKTNYRVIGVAKPRGTVFFFDFDDLVYIPVQTTQKLIMGIDYISAITSQLEDPSEDKIAIAAITDLMRDRHDIANPDRDDFDVASIAEAQDLMGQVVGGITLLLVALAGISLVVGGVGIMNIMYASVSERTFEIGLRKSVGASQSVILKQFLVEAILITFLGGVIGVALGIVLTYIIFIVANYYNFDWPLAISIPGIFLALAFSIVVGLVFGLYPAKRAAGLNPITALHKE